MTHDTSASTANKNSFSGFGSFSTSKMINSTSNTAASATAATGAATNTKDEYDGQYEHDGEQAREGPEGLDADSPLTLRALVSTKEAGVIIGKAGKNVADLRDQTGVKAGVSKVVQGVHDRVLTVSGSVEGVAKAFSLIAQTLLENPITSSPPTTPVNPLRPVAQTSSVRLLISHNLMGTIIGRQGLKIKHIQDTSSARMVASKDMLPQSTEPRTNTTSNNSNSNSGNYTSRTGNGSDFTRPRPEAFSQNNANLRTQEISIPADMVGCIIGKGGSKISEIRRLSGSRISIAKVPHDDSGERMFTIVGTLEANEKALYLLYGQLEAEKDKRLNMAEDHVEDDEE
ncbi:RNA binding protein, heterogenous nuclear RNP-K like protein [Linnemannia schmuckeri]|uniref:RNA binding protein, heterogenous nuclear RNP-K like protein n=1 Tax=Linnemannia schmuckeri TaxID=64567 RepID=A0A9P5VBN2_9FUNG|nr:RNA binding protein, heterogenous nuclear RNP-K like protein [Linnemannia schmuckeri]